MNEEQKKMKQLLHENEELRLRLKDAEDTLEAIHNGEVDALLVHGPGGEKVYVLNGADYPYRLLIDTMNEGAATVTSEGIAVYCNQSLLSMLKIPLKKLRGSQLRSFIAEEDRQT